MPMYDFECACGNIFEDLVPCGIEKTPCPKCDGEGEKVFINCPATLTVIIPVYPGCKRHKAGYTHTHSDRPKTKTQGTGWSPGEN